MWTATAIRTCCCPLKPSRRVSIIELRSTAGLEEPVVAALVDRAVLEGQRATVVVQAGAIAIRGIAPAIAQLDLREADLRVLLGNQLAPVVRVWAARRQVSADGPLTACAIAPDGTTVITGNEAGRMHILRFEGSEG